MEAKKIRKIKWFWGWNDDKEETWLGEMASQGWHLSSIGVPGVYWFTSGEPQETVYRLDFITSSMKDRQEYYELFRDAGWEHVGAMSGWQYFRKQIKPGEGEEIFTDAESKAQKYQRLLGYLIIFLPIWLFLLIILPDRSEARPEGITFIMAILYVGFSMIYTITTIKIIGRINELKRL